MINWQPKVVRLELGEMYIVSWMGNNPIRCKFIQPTRCGYNFLNIKTNKCILKQHLYPSKKIDPIGEMFFVSNKLRIHKYDKI